MRRTWWVVLALPFLVPIAAWAGAKMTLTPTAGPVKLTETKEFTAVVTGTSQKTVKFKVCDGAGQNCVTNGNTTVGTLTALSPDANGNPQVRYTAPATLPAIALCQSVVLGCQVKVQAILKVGLKKKKSFATVTLAAPGVIRRASVAADGSQANGPSHGAGLPGTVSSDGRLVVFQSEASNLVPNDTNGVGDIFLRDTCGEESNCTPSTTRVSVAMDGGDGNAVSEHPVISSNGRYAAFSSRASNLVPDDTNGVEDVFVRDTCFGAITCTPSTVRVSVASDGSEANENSGGPLLSADGRFVAFTSGASNLVAGDTSSAGDVFVHDTCAGAGGGCSSSTIRASLANDGSEPNSHSSAQFISADGRFVAFASNATNLVVGDNNGAFDAFVRDTCLGAGGACTPSTVRVSVASDGSESNGTSGDVAMGGDGRFVAFVSIASNLVAGDGNSAFDVFVRDTCVGVAAGCVPRTLRVSVAGDGSQANGDSFELALSADGRFVVFGSTAANLVGGDTNDVGDVFVRDTCFGGTACTPSTTRLSVAADGGEANGASGGTMLSLSPDGRFAAFDSDASNLAAEDSNTAADIVVARTSFVRPPLAYVAQTNPSAVAVIDTGTNTLVQTIGPLSPIDDPIGIVFTPDGTRAYVTLQFSGEVAVLNALSNTQTTNITVGSELILPAITPDGTRVYVPNQFSNNVMVIDTGTNTVTATIGMGTKPIMVAITADGKRAYVSNIDSNEIKIIDTDTASGSFHTVIGTIPVTGGPAVLAFSPDGSSLYASLNVSNQVAVINTSTNMVTTKISVGAGPIGVGVTPDGSRLYVANSASASVSVINTATNSVINTIAVAALPQLIAIAPEGPTIYLTHDSSVVGAVSVISVATNTVTATIPVAGTGAGIVLRFVR